jgi:hypothetical protein
MCCGAEDKDSIRSIALLPSSLACTEATITFSPWGSHSCENKRKAEILNFFGAKLLINFMKNT